MQAGLNKSKVQACLILDASLPESYLTLQIMTKVIGVSTIAYTLDNHD